jgi:hypothetical protein
MTEQPLPGGVKTLAVRLPDELRAQLELVAGLDGVSLAEAIRSAVEDSITRRRDSGELAARAQAALDAVDQEVTARRNALQSFIGQPAEAKPGAPAKPNARRRDGDSTT